MKQKKMIAHSNLRSVQRLRAKLTKPKRINKPASVGSMRDLFMPQEGTYACRHISLDTSLRNSLFVLTTSSLSGEKMLLRACVGSYLLTHMICANTDTLKATDGKTLVVICKSCIAIAGDSLGLCDTYGLGITLEICNYANINGDYTYFRHQIPIGDIVNVYEVDSILPEDAVDAELRPPHIRPEDAPQFLGKPYPINPSSINTGRYKSWRIL